MKKILKIYLTSLLSIMFIGGCTNTNTNTNTSSSNNNVSSTSNNLISESSTSSSSITSTSSISVEKKKVNSISINYVSNMKYEYMIGEELDLSNVTINVIYDNNENETINVTLDMVQLIDSSINQVTDMNSSGYKMVIISYEGCETSYLIEVIDPNAPIDKIDPLVVFDFDAGTQFTVGSDVVPGVTIYPNDLEYKVTYSSDESGYDSEEFPSASGTYSMVINVIGNDKYNSLITWRWFILAGEKEAPVITFNYTGGTTFSLSSTDRPTVTVSEGADYTITYSSDTTGYDSEEFPTEPGTYSLVVVVTENEKYSYAKKWLWFRLVD